MRREYDAEKNQYENRPVTEHRAKIAEKMQAGLASMEPRVSLDAQAETGSCSNAASGHAAYAQHYVALQGLRARELHAKVEDLKRFVRENIPGDKGQLAQFKFDEGYLWAKEHFGA